jgi:hypothetical protein
MISRYDVLRTCTPKSRFHFGHQPRLAKGLTYRCGVVVDQWQAD